MLRRLGGLFKWLSLGLTAAALVKELRTPTERRTWHGQVAGFVPYDFRVPSLKRVEQSYWNPDDSRLLTPTVFGVGWALNLGRLARLARSTAR